MNVILGQVLPSLLGDYVYPEGLRNLTATFSGLVELKNLVIKPEAIDRLEAPFKIIHGSVGLIRIELPGGVTGLFSRIYNEPVKVTVDGVFLLVDKLVRTAADAARQAETGKRSALDFDTSLYRQSVVDRLTTELTSSLSAAAGSKKAAVGLVDAILKNLQVDVTNVHIRYEDFTSMPGRWFGVGVTLAGFSTSASAAGGDETPTPTAAPPAVASQLLRKRDVAVRLLTVYVDVSQRPPGAPVVAGEPVCFAQMLTNAPLLYSAFLLGISTKDNAAQHTFMLEPFSPNLKVVMNPNFAVAGEPHVRATLTVRQIRVVVTQDQLRAVFALQHWLSEQTMLLLREQLRAQFRPSTRPTRGRTRAWWIYARRVMLALQERARILEVGAAKRWDASRVKGSLALRDEYMKLFKSIVKSEYKALRKGVEKSLRGDAAAMDALDAAVSKDDAARAKAMEARLFYEQVLEYRAEARVVAERDIAAEGSRGAASIVSASSSSGGSWLGWFGMAAADTAPSPVAPSTPTATSSMDDDVRARFEASVRGAGSAVQAEVRADIKLASISLQVKPDEPVVNVFLGGSASFTQQGLSWTAGVDVRNVRVVDCVSAGTVYPAILARAGDDEIAALRAKLVSADSALASQPSSQRPLLLPSGEAPPLVSLAVVNHPLDDASADIRVQLRLDPVVLVASPAFIARLLTYFSDPFAQQAGTLVSGQLAALQSTAAADMYGLLASHKRIDLQVDLASPLIVCPTDMTSLTSDRLVLRLGDFRFRSTPAAPLINTPLLPSISAPLASARSLRMDSASSISSLAASTASHAVAGYDYWRMELREVAVYVQRFTTAPSARQLALLKLDEANSRAVDVLCTYALGDGTLAQVLPPVYLTVDLQSSILPAEQTAARVRVAANATSIRCAVSTDRVDTIMRAVRPMLAALVPPAAPIRPVTAVTPTTDTPAASPALSMMSPAAQLPARSTAIQRTPARHTSRAASVPASAVPPESDTDTTSLIATFAVDSLAVQLLDLHARADTDAREHDILLCLSSLTSNVRVDATVARIGLTVRSFEVVDAVQAQSSGLRDLIHSENDDRCADGTADLVRIMAEYQLTSQTVNASTPTLRMTSAMNVIKVNYNASTIAKLVSYADGITAVTAAPVEAASAPGATASPAASLVPIQSPVAVEVVTVAPPADASPFSWYIDASFGGLSISLNDDAAPEATKLALLECMGVRTSVASRMEVMRVRATLQRLSVRNTIHGDSIYPYLLQPARTDAADLLSLTYEATAKTAPSYAGIDASVTVDLAPIIGVYDQGYLLRLIHFVNTGIAGAW